MTLHWFSPLPPAHSGIAEYAAMLAPYLSAKAKVTFWTDQSHWDKALENHGRVRRYTPEALPWEELNQGVCIYHLGNNPGNHAAIWRVSQLHAGVMILHDARLQDFFWGLFGLESRDDYVRLMREAYGEEGGLAAGAHGTPNLTALATRYPLIEPAIDQALGVVVHTQPAFDLAVARFPGPVACLPLAYLPSAPARARRASPPYRIVVFGYINPNRRLTSLIRALGESPARDQFRIRVCGQIWDDSQLRKAMGEFGVERHVTLSGYVADLDQILAESDLAVNLRYPSLGEASISQLRIWDHALPSVVTRTGWYATLPEDSALLVNPETEIEDLKRHLADFAADPQRFAAIGARGHTALAQHNPERYAVDLLEFMGRAKEFRATRAAIGTARRAGREMGGWLGGDALGMLAGQAAGAVGSLL